MPSVQAIIDRQIRLWEMEKNLREAQPAGQGAGPPVHPVITVSREHGSGGSRVAELIAQRFNYTLLHRDVIDRICASAHLRRSIVESLDQHVKSQLAIWCDAMVAQRYTDSNDYVRFLLEIIRSTASLGGVVVVGRGSNFIVGADAGLHVRIVAPREQRIQTLVQFAQLTSHQAEQEMEARDRERAEFVRKVLGREVTDADGYDLVINSAEFSPEQAVELVATAAQLKFERLRIAAASAESATG
ncbi:MAG: cytidylate kinase-like family protein [Candidatus Eisenbacteria bacterium]|nr:cytidylate kinase-like family protein [Candidatus Eisenbacteria bacterium]